MGEKTANVKIEARVDIGANIGHISIPLIKMGVMKNAIGYEPDPENHKLLKCNAIIYDVESKLSIFSIAIGENAQEDLLFELSEGNYGDHRIHVSKKDGLCNESKRKLINIVSRSLDSSLMNDESPLKTLL